MCLILFAEFSIAQRYCLIKVGRKVLSLKYYDSMNVYMKSAIIKTHFMHVPEPAPLMAAVHYASPKCKYKDRSAVEKMQIYNQLGVEWLPEL